MGIKIRISKDERQAFLTVISDEEDISKELTIDELRQAFSKKSVVQRIKENTLDQIWQLKEFDYWNFVLINFR